MALHRCAILARAAISAGRPARGKAAVRREESAVDVLPHIENIAAAIGEHRFTFSSERDLHDGLAELFGAAGFVFSREHRLSAGERVDFLIAPGVGVEVKVDGGLSEITRQLHRYVQCGEIAGLVLATNRLRHGNLPPLMNRKPVRVVNLLGGLR